MLLYAATFAALIQLAQPLALRENSRAARHVGEPTCSSLIYCQGDILHTVQMSRAFSDSKTFVDMCLRYDEATIRTNYDKMMTETSNNPTREQVREFVLANFDDGNEIEWVEPADWKESPKILDKLKDPELKEWVKSLNYLWNNLTRQVKPDVRANPTKYSIEPVPNHFVIPGGRFKEIYYWDSYWIIKGLLLCEMDKTAKGMIENLIWLVDKHGFIPNGGRVYYAKRSQPPLLSHMIRSYINSTNDLKWLQTVVNKVENELNYWLREHFVTVSGYNLARYHSPSDGPRPESYREDFITAAGDESKYTQLKTCAESGLDFTTRWVIDDSGGKKGNLSDVAVSSIIPVELNAYLCGAFQNLAYFYKLLGNTDASRKWQKEVDKMKLAIEKILWNQKEGIWFDYNLRHSEPRKFFYITNTFPLWTHCVPNTEDLPKYGDQVVSYLERSGALNYPGGVPTSLEPTGEQWDFPSAWAPLESIFTQSLFNSGNSKAEEIARDVSVKWVKSNFKAFKETKEMYEKYDVETPGKSGGGGEYNVQTGFGWSNGVVIEMLNQYADDIVID